MRSGRIAIGVGVALLVALLVGRGAPLLTQKREVIASVPTPGAVGAVSPIELKPGSQVCTTLISYSPDAQVARVVAAGDPKTPGPPLMVNADGPGYHTTAQTPGGYPGTGPVEFALDPPKHSLIGQFCVRNKGKQKVVLAGTQEGRTVGRSVTLVDAQPTATQLSLTLHRTAQASVLARLGEMFRHDAALNPMSPAMLWILALAVLILVPLGAFWALASSFRAGEATVLGSEVTAPPLPFARPALRLRERLAPAWARVRAIPAPVWLTLILLAAGLWFLVWAGRTHTFQNDENRYIYLARWVDTALPGSLWDFNIINTGLQRLSIWIMAPIVGLFGGPWWARIGHAVNVGLWVSTAIPVYLIVRGLRLPGRWAILAAVLTVFIPWAVLTTSFLTEPVAYPAFAFALWAIWRAVTRPTPVNDLLALALCVVAGLARVSLLALAGVLVIAIVAQELRFGRGRPVRQRLARLARGHIALLVVAALVGLGLLLVATGAISGSDKLFGYYGLQNRFHVPTQLLTSKLDVYTTRFTAGFGFVPFAFGLAWFVQTIFRPRDPDRFAFAVIATLVVASIVYTAAGAGFDERYIIYYAPLFAIAFAVALGSRETNPFLVGGAGLVGAYLLLTETWNAAPQGAFSWFASPAETIYANVVLGRLANDLPSAKHVREVAFVLALLITALCVVAASRHRAARTLTGFLVAGVILVQLFQTQDAISRFVDEAGSRTAASDRQRSWIDQKLYGKSHAEILAIGPGNTSLYNPIWSETQFWNDSVTGVDTVGPRGIGVPPSDTFVETKLDPEHGRLVAPKLAPYLLVPRMFLGVGLDTKLVGQSPYLPVDLVQLRSKRLLWTSSGAESDGFMLPGQPVQIRAYKPATVTKPLCAHADVTGPPGLNSRATLSGPGAKDTQSVPATKAVRVQIPLNWHGSDHADLRLTATGKVALADARVRSVQLSGVGVEPCPPSG